MMMKRSNTRFAGLVRLVVSAAVIGFSTAAVAGDGPDNVQWNFNQDSGLGHWSLNGVKEKMVGESGLNMITGRDSQMQINKLGLDAGVFAVAEITMKSDRDGTGQIFFAAPGTALSEKASVRFPVKGGEKVVVYRVNCGANPLWTGTVDTFRLDPIEKDGAKIQILRIKLLAASAPAWNFGGDAKLAGWSANPDFKELKYSADALTFISGKDSYMVSPRVDFPAVKFQTCEVVMKADKSSSAQLFFIAPGVNWSEKASLRLPVKASAAWQTLTFKCGGNPLWKDNIRQLRLDPVGPAGIKVEIKSIRVLP